MTTRFPSYRRRKGPLDREARLRVDKRPNLRLLVQDGAVFILRGYAHGPCQWNMTECRRMSQNEIEGEQSDESSL